MLVQASITTTQYVVTQLVTGSTYSFKLTSFNSYGTSLNYSVEYVALCASKPFPPTIIQTTLSLPNIIVSWNQAASNGSPITAY